MKQLKSTLAVTGLLGIIAVFLPYVSIGDLSASYWDFRKVPGGNSGLLNGPNQVYIALVCFAVPMLLGLLAIATKQLARWQAIVSGVFFASAFALEGVRKGLLGEDGMSTAIGGKLLFAATAIGLVTAIIGSAKPDKA
jgi:hypothetical protein